MFSESKSREKPNIRCGEEILVLMDTSSLATDFMGRYYLPYITYGSSFSKLLGPPLVF